ncbi:universal stress protein [Desulfobacula sp.]|uniref:universal stress protein n=1 Tax=Desulfobacula sp. TaxID=2593537 RepID=UPI00263670A1|nr:universal stress protein [Desulfobacula sp.]
MNNKVLIVFENEQVFSGALTYAREYAARSDARVTFLMLVAMSFSCFDFPGAKRKMLQEIETKTGKLLAELTETFIQKSLETCAVMRIGDPSQELLKFLADRPSFQAIIWGSGEDLPFTGSAKKKHWLCHLSRHLECPLLTVTRRLK